MLLPIIENKAESDTIPQDFDLKYQEIADMNTHSVLITGEIKGHRDALFYHIIRKYFCIPISVINKENELSEENINPYPDILTSMMKGLYEDIHGKIIDGPSTPLPYAVIKEEVKSNEQSKTFCIICPTHEKYEEKLAHNRPNSDILLHCLDYQSIKDQSDVQGYLCDSLKEPIQGLRSNQIVLLLHMDDIEEIKAGELQKLETNCRDCMRTLRPKSEQELGYPPSISVIPVNLEEGINLFTRKTEDFGCLMEILSRILSHKECEDSKFPILAVTSECQGKISYEWLSRGTIDPKVSYKVYPSNENITLSYIKDDPLSFTYSLARENQEDANSDCADSISSEEDKEESKVSMDTLRRGSIITSIEEERVNLSQKLMVEFELFSNATIVTKGFIFDLLLHSAHYEATIASLDGIVRYKDDIENPTGIPERVYKKSPIKMVKSGDIFVCIVSLKEPVPAANHCGTSLGLVSALKDTKVIARGRILKHVPFKT